MAAYIVHSRALGKGHGVKYGGVYSMEWEAIGKYIKNVRKWETSANKLCKLGGNKLGIIYATHCAHQIAKKYVLPPPHYQPPKMKIIEHFGWLPPHLIWCQEFIFPPIFIIIFWPNFMVGTWIVGMLFVTLIWCCYVILLWDGFEARFVYTYGFFSKKR